MPTHAGRQEKKYSQPNFALKALFRIFAENIMKKTFALLLFSLIFSINYVCGQVTIHANLDTLPTFKAIEEYPGSTHKMINILEKRLNKKDTVEIALLPMLFSCRYSKDAQNFTSDSTNHTMFSNAMLKSTKKYVRKKLPNSIFVPNNINEEAYIHLDSIQKSLAHQNNKEYKYIKRFLSSLPEIKQRYVLVCNINWEYHKPYTVTETKKKEKIPFVYALFVMLTSMFSDEPYRSERPERPMTLTKGSLFLFDRKYNSLMYFRRASDSSTASIQPNSKSRWILDVLLKRLTKEMEDIINIKTR